MFELVGWLLFTFFAVRATSCAFMLSVSSSIPPSHSNPRASVLMVRMVVATIVACWAWRVLHLG